MQQMLTQCEIQMYEFASLPCNLAEVFPQKHGKFYCKFTLRQAAYSTNLGFYEQAPLIFPWYVTPQLPVPFINHRSHFVVFFFRELCLWDTDDGICIQTNVIPGMHLALLVSGCHCTK